MGVQIGTILGHLYRFRSAFSRKCTKLPKKVNNGQSYYASLWPNLFSKTGLSQNVGLLLLVKEVSSGPEWPQSSLQKDLSSRRPLERAARVL
jgi:hypothetical protein